MTFEEWLDRHPAIRNMDVARAGYEKNVIAGEGSARPEYVSGAEQAHLPEFRSPLAAKVYRERVGITGSHNNAELPLPGGPDKPPASRVNPVGGTYKEFVKSHGGKSRAGLAAIWRTANNMPMTKKMAQSAAGRRLLKKQHAK
jgi:hypothetical protein